MTAHINAKAGDFAPTVIMPGRSTARKIYCRKLSYGLPRSYQRA